MKLSYECKVMLRSNMKTHLTVCAEDNDRGWFLIAVQYSLNWKRVQSFTFEQQGK